MFNLYRIEKNNCPSGYAYVMDFKNNRIYYGPLEACKQFINDMERAHIGTYKELQKAFEKYMKEV